MLYILIDRLGGVWQFCLSMQYGSLNEVVSGRALFTQDAACAEAAAWHMASGHLYGARCCSRGL